MLQLVKKIKSQTAKNCVNYVSNVNYIYIILIINIIIQLIRFTQVYLVYTACKNFHLEKYCVNQCKPEHSCYVLNFNNLQTRFT